MVMTMVHCAAQGLEQVDMLHQVDHERQHEICFEVTSISRQLPDMLVKCCRSTSQQHLNNILGSYREIEGTPKHIPAVPG